MWHEGSHSIDVYWFRAKLEWGKGGQEHGYLGGQKHYQATKDFSVDGFYVRGSTVYRIDSPP